MSQVRKPYSPKRPYGVVLYRDLLMFGPHSSTCGKMNGRALGRLELSPKSSNEILNVQELLEFSSKELSAIEVMSPVHSGRAPGTARVPRALRRWNTAYHRAANPQVLRHLHALRRRRRVSNVL
ncbi:hypothetical protein ACJJTC_014621 [Scirpophaga incertulas]